MPTRQDMPPHTISADELRNIVGDVDEAKVIEILELTPSLEDVEQAATWAAGDGDVLSKEGQAFDRNSGSNLRYSHSR